MKPARIVISLDEPIGRIAPEIFGHFAEHLGLCVEEGLWVGPDSKIPNTNGIRSDSLNALRRLRVPVLRWPGGCYADDYHWEDGIGPREQRPRRVNIHWGQTIEDGGFGTHEFIDLCRAIGAQPYFAGNLGSGAVREMRDWVEYCNFAGDSTLARRRAANGSPQPFGVKYWGVGNENWGCGGNFCPEDYAVAYKQYSSYLRDFSGHKLFLVACGPNGNDLNWSRRFFSKLGGYRHLHGYAAHYYTWNRHGNYGTATKFDADQYYMLLHESLRIEDVVVQQRALMDSVDPKREIGLFVDEWGSWHPVETGRNEAHLYQQNSMRDAILAALTFNIFHRHADKVVMANIAQVCNVLQSMILTDGPKFVTTPTFSVFEMFRHHQGGQSVRTRVEAGDVSFSWKSEPKALPRLSAAASIQAGILTLSVVNTDATQPLEVQIELRGGAGKQAQIVTLANRDPQAHNTFETPNAVTPTNSSAEIKPQWQQTFAPASVNVMRISIG